MCWIGFSVAQGKGGVARKELYTYGPTLRQALADPREVYESIPKRLSDSNRLNTARAYRGALKKGLKTDGAGIVSGSGAITGHLLISP